MKTHGLTPQDGQASFCVLSFPSDATSRTHNAGRRRISPEAGRGLEKLGHALDYLTDEFVYEGCRFREDRGRLEAIELLASLNRQIYFACGVEPSLVERMQGLVRRWFPHADLRNQVKGG